MKKLIPLLALCLLLVSSVSAQYFNTDSLKVRYWELGWVGSDLLIGALSIDLAMGITDNQAIGLRSTITNDYFNNYYSNFYQGANYVYRGGLFHKIYLSSSRNRKFTFRHGLRYSISEYYSQSEEWIEFNRFGNTQYRLGTVDIEDLNVELGYEFIVGLQQRTNSLFFLEYYAGLKYMELVSTNSSLYSIQELKAGNNYSEGYFFTNNYPENLSLVVGLVIGLQRQP